LQHRLEIEGRAADNLEHIGSGGLLLERLAQFLGARLYLLETFNRGKPRINSIDASRASYVGRQHRPFLPAEAHGLGDVSDLPRRVIGWSEAMATQVSNSSPIVAVTSAGKLRAIATSAQAKASIMTTSL
jgi:hypothetical protein